MVSPRTKSIQKVFENCAVFDKQQIIVDVKNSKIIYSNSNSDTGIPSSNLNCTNINEINDESNLIVNYILHFKCDGKIFKLFECGICSKKCHQQHSLIRHLSAHSIDRNYTCKECGKAFRQQSTLTQHLAIHSTERPHSCEICYKTFNRTSTLISHKKTHSNIKPFQCTICGKGFHQKGNLKNHIYTHTNERPYKCTHCNKGFNQKSNLTCHVQKVHFAKCKLPWKCEPCNLEFTKRTLLNTHENEIHRKKIVNKNLNENSQPRIETQLTPQNNSQCLDDKETLKVDGLVIPAIKTRAMKIAKDKGEIPFAIVHFMLGEPLLVRVIDLGDDTNLLRPFSDSDCKEANENRKKNSSSPISQNQKTSTRVCIVAVVYQTVDEFGQSHFQTQIPKDVYNFSNTERISSSNSNIEFSIKQEDLKNEKEETLPNSLFPFMNNNYNNDCIAAANAFLSNCNVNNPQNQQQPQQQQQQQQQPKAIAVQNNFNSNWKQQENYQNNPLQCNDNTYQNIATSGLLDDNKDQINSTCHEQPQTNDCNGYNFPLDTNTFDESLNFGDILNNLSKTDIDDVFNSLLRY